MKRKKLGELSDHFPVVLACEYIDGLNIPTVSIDNVSSARKATEHLIQLGHTRIVHITGPVDVVLSRDRLKGYKQAMISRELAIQPAYIQEGDFNFESDYNQMLKLALEKPPTAAFVFNDGMAMGVVKAAKDSGLKVPEDLVVVSFDNIKMSSIFESNLTTINQPKYEIGLKAMELLLRLMNGESVQKNKYMLDDNLIVRQSCWGLKSHIETVKTMSR